MNFFEFDELTADDFKESATVTKPEDLPGAVKKEEVKKTNFDTPVDFEANEVIPLKDDNLEELTEEDISDKKSEKEEKVQKKEEKKSETPKKEEKVPKEDLAAYYEGIAKYLVEEGEWEIPLEDNLPEDFEWTAENFAEIAKQQNQYKAKKELESIQEEFGDQGRWLLEHAKNGGRVEDLLQNIQQQRDVASFDTSTLEGAEEVLKEYYESISWGTKAEILEEIDALKDRGEDKFKAIASKRQADLLNAIKEEGETLKREQEENFKRQQVAQQKFLKDLRENIYTLELPEREKKDLEKFQNSFTQLEDGRKVNQAYLKQLEINSDPKKYVKYLQFLKDFDNFERKDKVEKEVKKKQHLFFRQDQEFSKKSSQFPDKKGVSPSSPKFKFF